MSTVTLTASEILAKRQEFKEVVIESLGGKSVYVRRFNIYDLMKLKGASGTEDFSASAIIASICDEDGKRLFTEENRNDIQCLDNEVYNELLTAVSKYNPLNSEAAKEEAKN